MLSLYMATLSVLPCSDMHNECKDFKAKTEFARQHNHSEDNDDNCSPFCTCSCCNAYVTVFPFQPLTLSDPSAFYRAEKFSIQRCSFARGYLGNVWQPPRA